MRRLLLMGVLCLVTPALALAQGWSEPTFTPDLMTAPLTPPPVTGTTFYVDINSLGGTCNNSNAGTSPSAPWCTLTKALQTLTAGQAALVRTGTYNNGNINPSNSGTPGNYITFRAYPGESPIIHCAGSTFCFDGIAASSKSYIVFDGFEIRQPNQQYMVCWDTAGCHHWWFVNNRVHDNNQAAGFYDGFVMGSHHIVLSNNEIYNTSGEGFITNAGGTPLRTGNNIILEFNHVHDNGRDTDDAGGLKCGDVDAWNCIMRYNIVHDNWRNPSSGKACFTPGRCQGISGLYIDRGRDNVFGGMSYIYNNIVWGNDIGIQVYDTQGVRIFNNLVFENGVTPGAGTFTLNFSSGISAAESTTNHEWYNNTVVRNAGPGLNFWNSAANSILLRNNLVQGNGTSGIFCVDCPQINTGGAEMYQHGGTANQNSDFNLFADPTGTGGNGLFYWNGTIYNTLTAFKARSGNTMETNSIATAATFVNLAGDDYHLQAGSAGINQGTTVALFSYALENVTRPLGGTWDIGAYEFVVAASAAPTVTITAPTSSPTMATPTTPLTPSLGGTADDDVGVLSVTWSCPTCTPASGTATCGSCGAAGTSVTWSVATVGLSLGTNVITVTATDGDSQTATDTLTVTHTTTQLRLDAGGGGGTFSDGVYDQDAFFTGGTPRSDSTAIAGTTDDALYQTERYGAMQYNLPLANGTYTVTLKFAELFFPTGTGNRVFHVDLNGVRVLTNFDIQAVVGSFTALEQTFATTVTGENLPIVFTVVTNNPQLVALSATPAGPVPTVLRLVR